MRIAQVAPLFESVPPRYYGGTERVVSWLTEELVREGHEVTLFASGDSLTSAELVSVTHESLRLGRRWSDPLAPHILLMEHVWRRSHLFDVIHFHTDYLQLPFGRRISTPSLTTLHGRLDTPDLLPLFREYAEAAAVSVSDAQREPLPWLNWVGTVHHGLPVGRFRPNAKVGNYLAFLGRVSPEKGVDRAIEIARRVKMPLRMAAKIDEADRPYFESHVKPLLEHPMVEFVGEITEEQKQDFLGEAAALLFPIDWPEPFGLVMIEAMATGTPVIAFRRGSIPEVLEDGVSGFIVDDLDGAVRAIERLGELRRDRVRAAFEARFSSERMAREYLAVFQRVIEGGAWLPGGRVPLPVTVPPASVADSAGAALYVTPGDDDAAAQEVAAHEGAGSRRDAGGGAGAGG